MLTKNIFPESFDFGMPSVDIVDVGAKGLDKQAMVKRASVFEFDLDKIKKAPGRTYLHVITTGAYDTYSMNLNGDAFNEAEQDLTIPDPEDGKTHIIKLDGGLKKYHDKTYMDGEAAVYQEHKTKEKPSGEIVLAKYNEPMHRGELIIAVDTDKWKRRLDSKARGNNIYLSMGCRVPADICSVCGHKAHTMAQHCDHFKNHRGEIMNDGTRVCVFNDSPHFYDISGVDVPADKIAFVLNKLEDADGVLEKAASLKLAIAEASYKYGNRIPMRMSKSASILKKLAEMEKKVNAIVEPDDPDLDTSDVFKDSDDSKKRFILRIEKFPADEVIDACSSKGILLPPDVLFNVLGKDSDEESYKEDLCNLGESCCGDCSHMMQELLEDDDIRDSLLSDGMFDEALPRDINLDSILEDIIPEMGVTNPAVGARVITISIHGPGERKESVKTETDEDTSMSKKATALRRAYARYLVSFAERNNDSTCMNALRKCAFYGK